MKKYFPIILAVIIPVVILFIMKFFGFSDLALLFTYAISQLIVVFHIFTGIVDREEKERKLI